MQEGRKRTEFEGELRMDISKNVKNKSFGIVCAYMLFYLFGFFALEKLPVRFTIIHCTLDEKIPFCEYFIIPYVLWFFFIAGTVLYFYMFNESSAEYGRLIGSLVTGMTIFLVVSFVWPNRHMLRPNLTEDGIFIEAVRLLYRIDTPTNIFPSIHVFNTAACYLAIRKNERCKSSRFVMLLTGILSVSIILSTMFLKQHTVIDVVGALGLNWVCYGIFYKWMPGKRRELFHLLNKKQLFARLNLLSLFRIGIAVVFWGLSERLPYVGRQACLVGILLLSFGIDYAARREEKKCPSANEAGKLLRIAADRITQGVVLLHLMARYRMLDVLLLLFFVHEIFIAFTGVKEFMKIKKNAALLCYERVNAAALNILLVILMLVPGVTKSAANVLIVVCDLLMGGSILICLHCSRELRQGCED